MTRSKARLLAATCFVLGILDLAYLDANARHVLGGGVAEASPRRPVPVEERADAGGSPASARATAAPPASEAAASLVDGDVLATFAPEQTHGTDLTAIVRAAEALRSDPGLAIVLEGHADPSGSPEINLELSLARARWVRDRLLELEVPADRVEVAKPGSFEPAAPRDGAAERRVELRVVGRK